MPRRISSDYMTDGAFAAMREVKKATGEDNINVVGYCIGGTLLACIAGVAESATPNRRAIFPLSPARPIS